MDNSSGALAVKAKTFTGATLPEIETAINAFLAGRGSPAITSTTKLLQFDLRFDGTNYFAYALYTE